MPKNFRARQVETSVIAASGSGETSAQILIVTGSDLDSNGKLRSEFTSTPIGTDVFMFVSGSKGGRDAGKGVILLAGDTVISGTLYADKMVVEIEEATTGSLSVSGSLFVSASGNFGNGVTVNDSRNNTSVGNFQVKTRALPGMIVSDSTTNQLILHSSGTSAATAGSPGTQSAAGSDVATYISGAIGSVGVANSKGVTLVTGDMVVSGALSIGESGTGSDVIFYGEDANAVGLHWDADYAEHGALLLGVDDHGVDLIVRGETPTRFLFWDQSTDTLKLLGHFIFNDGAYDLDFRAESQNIPGMIVIDSGTDQLLLHASGTTAATAGGTGFQAGSDVAIYLSGTCGSTGFAGSKGVTLFTGDVVTSGSFISNEPGLDHDFRVASELQQGQIIVDGGTNQVILHSSGTSASSTSSGTTIGTDVAVFISGTAGTSGVSVTPKDSAGSKAVTVIAGDTVLSGNVYMYSSQRLVFNGSDDTGKISMNGSQNLNINAPGDIVIKAGGEGTLPALIPDANNDTDIGSHVKSFKDAYFQGDVNVTGSLRFTETEKITHVGPPGIVNILANQSVQIMGNDPNQGRDVGVFISGTVGSRANPSVAGTTLIGGDLFVSGNTYIVPSSSIENFLEGKVFDAVGSDVNFFVSGSASSQGSTSRAVSLFGGGLVVSGTHALQKLTSQPTAGPDQVVLFAYDDGGGGGVALWQDVDGSSPIKVGGGGWVDDGTVVRLDTITDHVGIGTTAPIGDAGIASLQVNGFTLLGDDSYNAGYPPTTKGSGSVNIRWLEGDSTRSSLLLMENAYNGTAGSSSSIYFKAVDVVGFEQNYAGITYDGGTNGDLTLFCSSSAGRLIFSPGDSEAGIINETLRLDGPGKTATNDGGGGYRGAVFNENATNINFRVESSNRQGAIFVRGDQDQVLILSGGAGASPNETTFTDTAFFVSGALASKGTAVRGTALFGGDLVVSGGLHGGYNAGMEGEILTLASNVIAGPGVFFYNGMDDWRREGLSGPEGEDVVFSISGSIGAKNEIDEHGGTGIACIGGDLVVSGNLHGGYNAEWQSNILNISSTVSVQGSSFFFDGGGEGEADGSPGGDDVVFSVSGSVGGKDQDAFEGNGGTAVFGGDLVVSGNTYFLPGTQGRNPQMALFGTDNGVTFFVSGGIGYKQYGGPGVSVFSGDLVTSGALYLLNLASADVNPLGTGADGKVVTDSSDVRLKTNIKTIDSALWKVNNLRGVNYSPINNPDKKLLGMIAQEVQEVVPEAVFRNGDTGYYGLHYGRMVGLLVEGMKDQQKQIDELKAEIEILKEE